MNAPATTQEAAHYIAQDAKPMPMIGKSQFSLAPSNLSEAMEFARMMADSEMVPKNFRGKPGDVLIAVQMGSEVGLSPMAAIQNIGVINGKPGLYGDAGKAILLAGGCIIEEDDIEIVKATGRARCKITRKGRPPVERTYSLDNAKTAGLWGKDGPWRTNPERQMAWRAFWFAARDAAADMLKGIGGAEELVDYMPTEREINPAPAAPRPMEPKPYPAADFERNLPAWRQAIADGKKTADQIIAMVSSKGVLSEEQKQAIREPAVPPDLFEQIRGQIEKATSTDTLDLAADLIGEVADPAQREQLTALYQQRTDKLMNG